MANLLTILRRRSEEISRYSLSDYIRQITSGYGLTQQVVSYTAGGKPAERIPNSYVGYAEQAYGSSSVVGACMRVRRDTFRQAKFAWREITQDGTGKLKHDDGLSLLEKPWPNGTTGELLAKMITDVDLCGNSFVVNEGDRLRWRRPDWMYVVLSGDPLNDYDVDVVGYIYCPGGTAIGDGKPYLVDEVCHWSPIPHPTAEYVGMSWMTPALKDIASDIAATDHKNSFFRNGATLGPIFRLPATMTPDQFEKFKRITEQTHTGEHNAYRTLYVGGGAEVTLAASTFQQLELKATQGGGETRIAALAGCHPAIVGLSEGLQGSSLNAGNFAAARRVIADITLFSLWQDACAALSSFVQVPDGFELWIREQAIPLLREDAKDAADIEQVRATTITTLVREGFTAESAVAATMQQDMRVLKHTGMTSVQLHDPSGATGPDGEPVDDETTDALSEALDNIDFGALRRAFDPSQLRAPEGTPIGGRWIRDLLGLGERINLGEGEQFAGSNVIEGADSDLLAAWTHGPSGWSLRLGVGVSPGDRDRWKAADRGSTVVLDEDAQERLKTGLREMVQAGATGAVLREREDALIGQRRDILGRRGLSRRDAARLDQLNGDIASADTRLRDIAASVRERTARIEAGDPDARFLSGRNVLQQREADQLTSLRGTLSAERDRITAAAPPLSAQDQAALDRVQADLDRLYGEVDDSDLVSGTVPARWGDLRYSVHLDNDFDPQYSLAVVGNPAEGLRLDHDGVLDLLEMLGDEVERAYYGDSPGERIAPGRVGGGRFRKLTDRLTDLLEQWVTGDGPDDPLDGFNREQLRKTAKELADKASAAGDNARAARLTPRRGASSDEIKLALYTDIRASRRGERDVPGGRPEPRKVTPAKKAVPRKAPAKKAALRTGDLLDEVYTLEELDKVRPATSDLTFNDDQNLDNFSRARQQARAIAARWDVSEPDLRELQDVLGPAGGSRSGSFEDRRQSLLETQFLGWQGAGGGAVATTAITSLLGSDDGLNDREREAVAQVRRSPAATQAVESLGRAVYDATQGWFRERGVTHVRAFRGTLGVEGDRERPWTSWSLSPASTSPEFYLGDDLEGDEAAQYVQRDIRVRDVPVEEVFSIPPTGFGTYHEQELVVLRGAPVKTAAKKSPEPKKAAPKAPDADLSTIDDPEALRDALDLKKVPELKDMLREAGLPVSGRKRELVDRLVDARAPGKQGKGDAPSVPPAEAKATARQAQIDAKRKVADGVGEVLELLDNGVSPEGLRKRISASGLDDASKAKLLAAMGPDSGSWRSDLDRQRLAISQHRAEEPLVVTPLRGGNTGRAEVREFADGTRTVRKTTVTRRGESGEEEDAEVLAPLVLSAVGVRAPAVVRSGPDSIEMPFVAGRSGYDFVPEGSIDVPASILDSDDGRLLGLADTLMGLGDRSNPGNWLMDADGRLVAIDHGTAFLTPGTSGNPFARHFFDSYAGKYRTNDLTKADVAAVRARLEQARPEFDALGRGGWLDEALSRLDEVGLRAKGKRDRVARNDDAAALPAAAHDLAADAGLTQVGEHGTPLSFDPKQHTFVGDQPRKGQKVAVIRPGYVATVDGEPVVVSKAKVETWDDSLHGPPAARTATGATPVPIRDLFAADDATIEAAMRDVYEGQFGPYTTKVTVSRRSAGTDRRGRHVEPSISIEGKIYDEQGGEIGRFSRSIGPTETHYADGTVRREIWAEHQIVELGEGDYDENPTKYHGKGFGGAFNRRAIEWYRASGVHGISQSDHNGYVWASQGFNFTGGVVPEYLTDNMRALISDLRSGKATSEATKTEYRLLPKRVREAPDLDAQIAAAESLLARVESGSPRDPGYPTAYEISQLGRRPGQRGKTELWFGKLLYVSADEMILNSDEGEVVSQ